MRAVRAAGVQLHESNGSSNTSRRFAAPTRSASVRNLSRSSAVATVWRFASASLPTVPSCNSFAEQDVLAAAHQLVDAAGIETDGDLFINSYRNPIHERHTEEIVRGVFPNLPLCTSHASASGNEGIRASGPVRQW